MTERTHPRRGLGRGLGSLIPTAPVPAQGEAVHETAPPSDWIGRLPATGAVPPPTPPEQTQDDGGDGAGRLRSPSEETTTGPGPADGQVPAGAYFAELAIDQIVPNARQPRQVFEGEALAELVHSVREVGLLQPVVVRPSSAGEYELIMGERRWRAAIEAGLSEIPAIVRETDDADMLRDALLENLHRAELNPLEEAAAYQQLLEDFGCTHEELAGRIGRSRPQISNTLRLLKLSAPGQRRVAAGVLSAGHARALLTVADPDTQDRLAQRVVSEGISVRGLEETIALGELGDDPVAPPRRKAPTSPALLELAGRLSDLYDTRVKVDLGRSKGKIVIEYASLEDLERIVAAMDPTYQRAPAFVAES
jgi:ParB family transcriptional regulator, chromosome partitioning protein